MQSGPAFSNLRLVVVIGSGLTHLVGLIVWWMLQSRVPDSVEIILVAVAAAFFFVMHLAAMSGDGDPNGIMPLWAVIVFAIVFGVMGMLVALIWWFANMEVLDEFTHVRLLGETKSIVALFGLVLVIVSTIYAGMKVRRYAFLRMLVLQHVVGMALMAFCLYLRYGNLEIKPNAMYEFRPLMYKVMVYAAMLCAWWGLAPSAYLIAYRRYRRPLLPELPPQELG